MAATTAIPLRQRRRRRQRRAVAVTAVAGILLGTVSYWLASSGGTSVGITPPAGLTNGQVADVKTMSASVSASNGGAQTETGKTIAKVLVAKDYTNKIKLSIAWTNVTDAAKVLNNPHAQIVVGLYHPVKLSSDPGTCTAPLVRIVDNGSYFCAEEDTASGGSQAVSNGELFLAESLLSGYLAPSADGTNAAATPCTLSSAVWCQPVNTPTLTQDATNTGVGADQRLIYVVASITVPGGIPQGQQSQLGSLTFFLKAARTT